MATYDPPQPGWKRAIAGMLDFGMAFMALGLAIGRLIGNQPGQSLGSGTEISTSAKEYLVRISFWPEQVAIGPGFNLEGLTALLLYALLAGYFFILGRTGGTLFQRAFGMKRARPRVPTT